MIPFIRFGLPILIVLPFLAVVAMDGDNADDDSPWEDAIKVDGGTSDGVPPEVALMSAGEPVLLSEDSLVALDDVFNGPAFGLIGDDDDDLEITKGVLQGFGGSEIIEVPFMTDCSNVDYSGQSYTVSTISVGQHFCVATNGGRFGVLRVDLTQGGSLTFAPFMPPYKY